VAVLPARSVAVPVTWPPGATLVGAVHDEIPDRPSAQRNVTVVLFPEPVFVAVMVGAVVSKLTVAVPVAHLPAGSHDSPLVYTTASPSVSAVSGDGVVGVPDDGAGSVATHVIVGAVEYQPSLFGAGDTTAVTVGGVVSSKPDTATGVNRFVVVPSPNSPKLLRPQHFTDPPDNSAHEWYWPVVTAVASVIPDTATGFRRAVVDPSPSSPR
jgi:hypothetical protein